MANPSRPDPSRRKRKPERGFTETHEEPNFKPEDLPFSEEEWHVPASDLKGHSTKEWVRMPPMMARALQVLVGTKSFPYSTINDLMLHAIYRHIFWLHRQDPKMSRTILRQAESIIDQMRDERNQEVMKSAIEQMSERCQANIDDGNPQEVSRIVMQVKSLIEEIPATSHWKQQFLTKWKERAVAYINAAKVVQMVKPVPTRLACLPKPQSEDDE